jgi:hypothetical protein
MLRKNPEHRCPIVEMKGHPWITNNGKEFMPEFIKDVIEVTEKDKVSVFTKARTVANVIMKMKALKK